MYPRAWAGQIVTASIARFSCTAVVKLYGWRLEIISNWRVLWNSLAVRHWVLKGVGGFFSGLNGWFMKEKSTEGNWTQTDYFELEILEPPVIGSLGSLHVLCLYSFIRICFWLLTGTGYWAKWTFGLTQNTVLMLLSGPLENTFSEHLRPGICGGSTLSSLRKDGITQFSGSA